MNKWLSFLPCCLPQDMCKMATEAISSGQTSVQAELRRTANTREYNHPLVYILPDKIQLLIR